MNIKIVGTVTFLLFISGYTSAQTNELKFNLVEGPHGKPLGNINGIAQDRYGNIWLAGSSEKCLYRYDGNRWTIYRHDPANPNSLGMITPETLCVDSKGKIWIGGNGLDRFNPSTGIFKHFKSAKNDPSGLAANYVNALLEDSKGRVWIGTSGLDLYDEKTESFIHHRHDPGDPRSLSDNIVRSIYEDRKGVIWVGTGAPFFGDDPDKGGLNRLEENGTFTQRKTEHSHGSCMTQEIRTVLPTIK
jgi:ligand-binding sensor domain-containing protein